MAAKKPNAVLGCIRSVYKSFEIVPLYSALVKLYLEYCVQFWTLNFRTDVDKLEQVQRRATRVIRRLETEPLEEERLKELAPFNLEERRLRGDMIALFEDLKECHAEEGQDLNHPRVQGM